MLTSDEVEEAVGAVAGEIALHAGHLAQDFESSSAGRTQDVPVAGVMPPEDVLCAIVLAAAELDAAALAAVEPPLGSYATPASAASIGASRAELSRIIGGAPECRPFRPEFAAVVEEYLETHLGNVSETMHAAERLVVLQEQAFINVYEPNERGVPRILAACGIAAVALFLVAL